MPEATESTRPWQSLKLVTAWGWLSVVDTVLFMKEWSNVQKVRYTVYLNTGSEPMHTNATLPFLGWNPWWPWLHPHSCMFVGSGPRQHNVELLCHHSRGLWLLQGVPSDGATLTKNRLCEKTCFSNCRDCLCPKPSHTKHWQMLTSRHCYFERLLRQKFGGAKTCFRLWRFSTR